jgi:AcrR family transcriptional regulator
MSPTLHRKGERISSQIVSAAARLFQERGFENTSFQDLAEEAGVPKGNFYYYFRSKDEVLDAVVQSRLNALDEHIKKSEESSLDPLGRIQHILLLLTKGSSDPIIYGCPHGSLCMELAKGNAALLSKGAKTLARLRSWFALQFRIAKIHGNHDHLALELLSRAQGVMLVGATFRDRAFVRREIKQLQNWVESLRGTPTIAARSRSRR